MEIDPQSSPSAQLPENDPADPWDVDDLDSEIVGGLGSGGTIWPPEELCEDEEDDD